MNYDAIVIGAGNGGLVSALKLQKEGKKVLLLESHNTVGGVATSFIRGRFEFEASLHELCGFGNENNVGEVYELFKDLDMLSKGIDVKIPQYLVNGTGIVVPNAISKRAEKIIVVEGMATMYGKVADLFDIKLYVDIAPEIQEKWFINRAMTSRNQNEENARKQLDYVRKASKKYILPKKNNSDIIINGASSLDYFTQIIEFIYKITNNYYQED